MSSLAPTKSIDRRQIAKQNLNNIGKLSSELTALKEK